jgi:hypothetical protein
VDDTYQEAAPPPALAPFVSRLWSYRADLPSGGVQRIVPDGCCELIVHLGTPYDEQAPDGEWCRQPAVLFAGQLTRPLALRPTGPVHVIAARFTPDGARPFLGAPLRRATDRTLDLSDRLPRPPTDLTALATWLETRRAEESWAIDPAVRAALHDQALPGHPAARRALQRAFLDQVGVPARTLRSIRRFRAVFERAEHPDAVAGAWLRAGLDAGYFDQPQMARDFRRFLGCTATDWARQQSELALRLASQSYKTDAIVAS